LQRIWVDSPKFVASRFGRLNHYTLPLQHLSRDISPKVGDSPSRQMGSPRLASDPVTNRLTRRGLPPLRGSLDPRSRSRVHYTILELNDTTLEYYTTQYHITEHNMSVCYVWYVLHVWTSLSNTAQGRVQGLGACMHGEHHMKSMHAESEARHMFDMYVCMYVCMYVWIDGWMHGWMDEPLQYSPGSGSGARRLHAW
jgi:hypothetical protein